MGESVTSALKAAWRTGALLSTVASRTKRCTDSTAFELARMESTSMRTAGLGFLKAVWMYLARSGKLALSIMAIMSRTVCDFSELRRAAKN